MIGGLAVRNNLLCVTWSAGRGHVFLYDLEAAERVSSWISPVGDSGYSDAGGVTIDRHFRIFVADAPNNCVRRFNAFGQSLGELGLSVSESGDRARDCNGVLDRPHAVAVHEHCLYVAMGEQPRRRSVQRFHVDGTVLPCLPARGDAANKWAAPRGIWADEKGVIISDSLRGRLQLFRHDGTFLHEMAVGQNEAGARPGHLLRLKDGIVLVIDHGATEGGEASELVGMHANGTRLELTDLASACRAPVGLAVDDEQRVYVLDHEGERVLRANRDLSLDRVMFHLAEHDVDAPGS